MIILGIDPGIAILGWGVIQTDPLKVIDYGYIGTDSSSTLANRLLVISSSLLKIIDQYSPDNIAVEQLFFAKNVKTALNVAHARGVILLCAAQRNIDIAEYTPLQVKQAVVGYGRADKLQIQNMIKRLLNLKEIPKPDDVADALAVALCHKNMMRINNSIQDSRMRR